MLFHFTIVYVFLFALGIGFARRFADETIQLAIAPLFGYCIISVLSVYFLYYDFNRIYLLYCLGVLTFGSLYLEYTHIKIQHQWKKIPWIALPIFWIVCIKMNNYVHGQILFGVNPDIASYISGADWLTKLRPSSSLSNIHIGNIINHTGRYEILHNALRWALPTNLSVFSLITKEPSCVFIFPLSAIILFSSLWTTVELFNKYYNVFTPFVMQWVIGMLALNASILFLLYEGFYPNIVGLGLFSVLCAVLIQSQSKKILFTGMFLVAALIATYSEIFIIFVLVAGLYALINTLQVKAIFSVKNNYIALICLCGLLLVFPLSLKIIKYTLANFANMSNVGFPQPTWITPSDIVGITNIYSDLADYIDLQVHVIGRSIFYLFISSMLSVWVVYELIKQRQHKLLCAAVSLLFIVFCYNYYRFSVGNYDPVNYLYDKIALILAIVITLYFYKSIVSNKFKLAFICILTIVSTSMFLSKDNFKYRGGTYFNEMKMIIEKVDNQQVAIITNARGQRQGEDIPQLHYVDRVQDIIWSEYTYKILDQWEPLSCEKFSSSNPIFLVASKKSLINASNYKNSIFETKHYIVINTKKIIKDICNKNFKRNVTFLYIK